MRKFASRNRGPVAAGTAIAATLLPGILGTTNAMLRACKLAQSHLQLAAEAKRQTHIAVTKQKEVERAGETLKRQNYIQLIGLAQAAVNKGRPADALELLDKCPRELQCWEWRYMNRLVGNLERRSLQSISYWCELREHDFLNSTTRV